MVRETRITITVGFPSLFCQPLVENPYNGRHFGIHSRQQCSPIRISPGYKNSITYVPSYTAQVIACFPLTDSNYTQSIAILKEKFGQPYKLAGAHMEAFLNIQAPANNLTGLQAFYDTL